MAIYSKFYEKLVKILKNLVIGRVEMCSYRRQYTAYHITLCQICKSLKP